MDQNSYYRFVNSCKQRNYVDKWWEFYEQIEFLRPFNMYGKFGGFTFDLQVNLEANLGKV